jgi:prepilin-type N-terminal cleavage/methylation domain-containing protein
MRNRSGFTLLELIVVVALWAIVLSAIAIPMARISGRSSIASHLSYETIVGDIQRSLKESMNGFAANAASDAIRNDKNLLPEDQAIYFVADNSRNDRSQSYYSLELQTRKLGTARYTRIIQRDKKAYIGNWIYLKQITLKRDDSDVGISVGNIAISYRNPTGNTSFFYNSMNYEGDRNVVITSDAAKTINEFAEMTPDPTYKLAELHFYDEFEQEIFIIKVWKDKQFYVEQIQPKN